MENFREYPDHGVTLHEEPRAPRSRRGWKYPSLKRAVGSAQHSAVSPHWPTLESRGGMGN